RVAADADDAPRRRPREITRHVPVARQTRAGAAAAVAVLRAEVAVDVAAFRALADGDARRSVRRTDAAATIRAARAPRAVLATTAAERRATRRRPARPDRRADHRAEAGAAIRRLRADVAGLDAERSGVVALARRRIAVARAA